MKHEELLTIDDLLAAVGAMDSWLDAFSDDAENDETVIKVRKVMERIELYIVEANRDAAGKPPRHLRLVKPEEEKP